MTEQTMIERMAWAIASTEYPSARGNDFWKDDIHKFSEVVERAFIAEARAALEAMQTPTDEMLLAAQDVRLHVAMADTQLELARLNMLPRWMAMIQAALTTDKQGK